MQTLDIIIPCYNEEDGIPHLVSQLTPVIEKLQSSLRVNIIFVNDGSRDHTVELIRAAYGGDSRIQIVSHEKNKGLGAAMRTGFEYATSDFVVTIDSDCTYPPDQIPAMLDILQAGVDMVTASPYHPKGNVVGVPEYRLFLSKSLSAIYRLLLRVNIYTFTALFRAYRKRVVKEIPFESNAFLATTEHLVGALRAGFVVCEFPTTLHVRRYGVSKIKLFDTITDHLKLLLRLVIARSSLPRESR